MNDTTLSPLLSAVAATDATADVLLAALACVDADSARAPFHALEAIAFAPGADARVRRQVLQLCSANSPIAAQISCNLLCSDTPLPEEEQADMVSRLSDDVAARALEGLSRPESVSLASRCALAVRGASQVSLCDELLTLSFQPGEHRALLTSVCDALAGLDGYDLGREAELVRNLDRGSRLSGAGGGWLRLAVFILDTSEELSAEDCDQLPVAVMRSRASGVPAMAQRIVDVLGDDANQWVLFNDLAGRSPGTRLGELLGACEGALNN